MRRIDITAPEFKYDPEDPDGFRSGMFRLGPLVGAKETGASVYEVPPGHALCPFHYEYGEEEWGLVLEGRATVRLPEGSEEMAPMQVMFFGKGKDGAHQIRNDSTETLRILMWSGIAYPAATVYPDSDKIAIWTGGDRSDDVIVPRSAKVDYFFGEAE